MPRCIASVLGVAHWRIQVEVFNVLFTVSGSAGHERKYFVHCMDCALSISPTLNKVVVLQQYDMTDLTRVYDSLEPSASG